MKTSITSLISTLEPDPWRVDVDFTEDLKRVHEKLFSPEITDDETIAVLADWLSKSQPCIFGRFAAQRGLLSYCVLSERDLRMSDQEIRDKIQEARRRWRGQAAQGGKSGFIILAVSPAIAFATPSTSTLELARRLCSLYLLTEIETDKIYLEHIDLDIPGPEGSAFRWDAGVNYFSAQGDRRWWHDHRIPGGMALSVNSVGHMVKSAHLANAMMEIRQTVGASEGDWIHSKVSSLEQALVWAMQTIDRATSTPSGKATELLPLSEDDKESLQSVPCSLPPDIAGKNYCEYQGFYHTDVTLPSVYFKADVDRSPNQQPLALDFTYLFDDSIENLAFLTTGTGLQIRSSGPATDGTGPVLRVSSRRAGKMWPLVIKKIE
jgi:hypothetical protein